MSVCHTVLKHSTGFTEELQNTQTNCFETERKATSLNDYNTMKCVFSVQKEARAESGLQQFIIIIDLILETLQAAS